MAGGEGQGVGGAEGVLDLLLATCRLSAIMSDRYRTYSFVGDNAVTSSIRIAKVYPKLGGKKTSATLKVRGNDNIYD